MNMCIQTLFCLLIRLDFADMKLLVEKENLDIVKVVPLLAQDMEFDDEYIAREERQELLQEATEWAKSFPYLDLVKKEWIPARTTILEKTSELLAFFGISSHAAWEDYYFNQQLKEAWMSLLWRRSCNAYSEK